MPDAARTEKRRAALGGLHRGTSAPASLAVARTRSIRSGRPASVFRYLQTPGTRTSSMVFSPACERPRALTALTPLPKTSARSSGSLLLRQRIAGGQKEAAVERPGRAADGHHQRLADCLERLVERLRADRIELAQHRLEIRASCWRRDRRRRWPDRARSIPARWRSPAPRRP